MNFKFHSSDFSIYNSENIDCLEWPETEDAVYARRYFLPLIKKGIGQYVKNINGSVAILKANTQIIPLLIVNNEYENSYVCSPYGHYILLGLESLHLLSNPFLRIGAQTTLKGMGKILKKGKINKIVYLNHWLFSTDLHPEMKLEELHQLVYFLRNQFPDHALAVRSINVKSHNTLKKHLEQNQFSFLLSRQVYLTDTNDESIFKTRILKSDLKLLRESDYEVIDSSNLQPEEHSRILELYNCLSIEQHSPLNPQLNLNFIQLLVEEKILEIRALKKNGTIEGIVGFLQKGKTLFCPFIGYDKRHPDKSRLYRILSTTVLLEARKKKFLMHQSAGASFYKTVRRAVGYQEYLAVYTSHLPLKQKMAWGLLQTMTNLAAAPLMKKY